MTIVALVIRWLLGPVGRWFALGTIALIALLFVIHSIQERAVRNATNAAIQDANKRLNDAIRNGDAVDLSPDKLRQRDPRCRDC